MNRKDFGLQKDDVSYKRAVYVIYDHRLLRADLLRSASKTSVILIEAHDHMPADKARVGNERIAEAGDVVQVLLSERNKAFFVWKDDGDTIPADCCGLYPDSDKWKTVEEHWKHWNIKPTTTPY